jgi:hypothetical protein
VPALRSIGLYLGHRHVLLADVTMPVKLTVLQLAVDEEVVLQRLVML